VVHLILEFILLTLTNGGLDNKIRTKLQALKNKWENPSAKGLSNEEITFINQEYDRRVYDDSKYLKSTQEVTASAQTNTRQAVANASTLPPSATREHGDPLQQTKLLDLFTKIAQADQNPQDYIDIATLLKNHQKILPFKLNGHQAGFIAFVKYLCDTITKINTELTVNELSTLQLVRQMAGSNAVIFRYLLKHQTYEAILLKNTSNELLEQLKLLTQKQLALPEAIDPFANSQAAPNPEHNEESLETTPAQASQDYLITPPKPLETVSDLDDLGKNEKIPAQIFNAFATLNTAIANLTSTEKQIETCAQLLLEVFLDPNTEIATEIGDSTLSILGSGCRSTGIDQNAQTYRAIVAVNTYFQTYNSLNNLNNILRSGWEKLVEQAQQIVKPLKPATIAPVLASPAQVVSATTAKEETSAKKARKLEGTSPLQKTTGTKMLAENIIVETGGFTYPSILNKVLRNVGLGLVVVGSLITGKMIYEHFSQENPQKQVASAPKPANISNEPKSPSVTMTASSSTAPQINYDETTYLANVASGKVCFNNAGENSLCPIGRDNDLQGILQQQYGSDALKKFSREDIYKALSKAYETDKTSFDTAFDNNRWTKWTTDAKRKKYLRPLVEQVFGEKFAESVDWTSISQIFSDKSTASSQQQAVIASLFLKGNINPIAETLAHQLQLKSPAKVGKATKDSLTPTKSNSTDETQPTYNFSSPDEAKAFAAYYSDHNNPDNAIYEPLPSNLSINTVVAELNRSPNNTITIYTNKEPLLINIGTPAERKAAMSFARALCSMGKFTGYDFGKAKYIPIPNSMKEFTGYDFGKAKYSPTPINDGSLIDDGSLFRRNQSVVQQEIMPPIDPSDLPDEERPNALSYQKAGLPPNALESGAIHEIFTADEARTDTRTALTDLLA
jgi:hypothetical protein